MFKAVGRYYDEWDASSVLDTLLVIVQHHVSIGVATGSYTASVVLGS